MAVLSTARAERMVDVWAGAAGGAEGAASGHGRLDAARTAAGRTDPTRYRVARRSKGAGGDRAFDASARWPAPSPSRRRRRVAAAAHDARRRRQHSRRRSARLHRARSSRRRQLAVSGAVAAARAHRSPRRGRWPKAARCCPFRRSRVQSNRSRVRPVLGATERRHQPPTVSGRLTTRAGAPLLELPVARMAGSDAAFQIDLPFASIARGDYLIAIAAAHGEERTRALLPVRIVR